MQRLLISLSSLVAFATLAHAQPAPEPAPPADPTAPPVVAEPPPPPVEPAKPKEELPKRLGVGTLTPGSFLTLGLNLQGWFVYDETKKVVAAGADDVNLSTSFFRLRRVEVTGSGDIIPKRVKYRFMFDPARVSEGRTAVVAASPTAGATVTANVPNGPFNMLQDAWVTLVGEYADILIGQFKTPISWDGFNSAAKLILPDRAFATTQLGGGTRDVGIRIEKTFKKFAYFGEVVNGSGQNVTDTNNQKDVTLRVEVYPVPGLTIAGVTYDSVGYRKRAGTKDRWEGDLRYEAGPFLFQGEFIQGRTVTVANGSSVVTNSRGAYAALAYMLKGVVGGKGDLQPVVRFGYYDPDIDQNITPANLGAVDERMDYEVGLNYYVRGHEMKFQVAYDRQQFDDSAVKPAINEVIVETQVWF